MSLPPRSDEVWKSTALVDAYLGDVRGAIPMAREQIDVMRRVVSASVGSVRRFLDLGCGDGVLAAALLEGSPDARGVLVDFSEPMIQAARSRLQAFGDRLDFHVLDYADPAWVHRVRSAGQFDSLISGYSIHHQPDSRKRELYREIFSLLRPGGVFVNAEHVAPATPWVSELFEAAFAESLYALEVRRGGSRTREQLSQELYHRPDKAANILAPVETQCAWLREIGFQDVDCYFKIFELAVFGGRRPAEH